MITHNEIDTVLSILAKEQSNTMLGRMGQKYDPFKVLISTILSARAKDEVTEVIAEELFKTYDTPQKLARADKEKIIKIIRKIGFYNEKSKNIINASKMLLDKFSGKVPDNLEQLIELPGVGRKVANCVLVYSFGKDALPIDTHCHRIPNRLGWIKTKTPEESEKELIKIIPRKHWLIFNDVIVSHGKKICLPINPKCSICPIYKYCKRTGVTTSR